MRILVTGGAGFIGSHVVEALVGTGARVRVLDALLAPGKHTTSPARQAAAEARLPPGTEFAVGDVRVRDDVDAALAGVDVVCHQAAMVGLGVDLDDLPAYASHNDLGTAVLLAAMTRHEVDRLVLASSMVVYGEGRYRCPSHGVVRPGPRRPADLDAGDFEPPCPVCGQALDAELVTEDAAIDPRNGYAASKVAQEHLAAAWARTSGGSAVALRYHNVYGPRMPRDTPYSGVAAIFRSAVAAGRAPEVFEDGGQRRDFVHVHDVAQANVLAVDRLTGPANGSAGTLRAYNVGSGTPHTIGDMAVALAETAGGPAPVVTGRYRLGDVRHVTASSERAVRELRYRPAVDFSDGMKAFATDPMTDSLTD